MFRIHVIGIGPEGPSIKAQEAFRRIKVAFGAKRHRLWLPKVVELRPLVPLKESLKEIKKLLQNQDLAVLASGDPLFFGIGRRLLGEVGSEKLLFYPAVSSIQLAFAALKEPWDTVRFISIHGRAGSILKALSPLPPGKVAILTTSGKDPGSIARKLCQAGLPHLRIWVLENLGQKGENITSSTAVELPCRTYSDLNLVILDWEPPPRPAIGLTVNEFSRRQGLITKDETRAVILAKLRLPREGVLWDIGAGSGSVSIEASGISPALMIYAIEENEEQLIHIEENIRRYGAYRIQPVRGMAPEALASLPSPDRVFIGGSGGRLREILETVVRRLKESGRIVLVAVTLDSLKEATYRLKELGLSQEVVSMQINRLKPSPRIFQAENMVFIITAERTRG
ncbi:precorrin-6y C5,15-methyltransferase (decarboxylating) subunit CbiE [Thermosulfuriphilus sp.]